jgi:RES domain-containing protein
VILWRISEFVDLTGRGGELVPGRWHDRLRAIVYTAETSPLAILENLAGLEIGEVPETYQLLRIEGPDDVAFTAYDKEQAPRDRVDSAAWGDAWLAGGETALARVPAVVAPHACNWLINPAHGDAAGFRVAASGRWPWDRRLFRR